MNGTVLGEAVALGALTGMRSMAGPATLAWQHDGLLSRAFAVMAAGEMVVDKTSVVGDRIDPIPLAGRALMGAIVGGTIARQGRENILLGGVIGGAAAVIAAHLAYRLRTRLPIANPLAGLLEDAVVMGLSAVYASSSRRRL